MESEAIETLEQLEKDIRSGLKDFQLATVDRVLEVFESRKRVLVSDEVGLGKTLIAKGVIAGMVAKHRRESRDPFKVVYVCSNGTIAEQNLSSLQFGDVTRIDDVGTSRLSMQHLQIAKRENDPAYQKQFVSLIPLTPYTSFAISGGGTVQERELIYAVLERIPDDAPSGVHLYMGRLAELMGSGTLKSWGDKLPSYRKDLERYPDYLKWITQRAEDGLCQGDLMEEIRRICTAEKVEYGEKTSVFERLRLMFAKISLEKLQPDLVIMDEFQRFRDLIQSQPDTDTGFLRQKFIQEGNAKMLLLSATPYKMYTTLEEMNETPEDTHFKEFKEVMDFLLPGEQEKASFKKVWKGYSFQLEQLSCGDTAILKMSETDILRGKQEAESAMYSSICRTERSSASETVEMVKHVPYHMNVTEYDVLTYVQSQDLLRKLKKVSKDQKGQSSLPPYYVKSSPYVMSFLRGYAVHDWVKKAAVALAGTQTNISTEKYETLWLSESVIDKYQPIPTNNARLKCLMDLVLPKKRSKEAQYLWVPPSLPYYPLAGVYEKAGAFTKTLVFSAWQMVPRMISTLVSYEVERRTIGQLKDEERMPIYPYKRDKQYLKSRLRFPTMLQEEKEPGKRPKKMTLFCLLYPSQYLTDLYSPLGDPNENNRVSGISTDLKQVKERLVCRIRKGLKIEDDLVSLGKRDVKVRTGGNEDRAWYYLAPMLLDYYGPKDGEKDHKDYINGWLNAVKNLKSGAGEELSEEDAASESEKSDKKSNNVAAYIDKLRSMLEDVDAGKPLGRVPEDLYEVLADMVIGSPAVCFHRSYQMYGADDYGGKATEAAMILLNRMDTPEALATVQLAFQQKEDTAADAHWRNLLKCCVDGCLQAVLDEYLHMLASGLPKTKCIVSDLHRRVKDGLQIRTSTFLVNTSEEFERLCRGDGPEPYRMRSHYAVAFSKTESENQNQDKDFNRKKVVRQAFNSPFWPFVLATTSIGHEGLDFHNYCRRIVHWNLPSNPIDLEQREGRIHRYKCLAIRQNVAKRYGKLGTKFQKDVWEELFDRAAQEEKGPDSSDLIPYWGLRNPKGLIPIERVVPSYPLSRDEQVYQRLIEILSLYRLTLGQANQEELLQYLEERFKKVELKQLFFNLSPYYHNQAVAATADPT